MKISTPIRVLPHAAGLPLPTYATAQSAGCDLLAAITEDASLEPGERKLFPTGICMMLPTGYEAQIRPRSGLALRHGVTVLNTPGTIDADYRGEIGILLINHGDAPYTVRRGMRIAQLVIAPAVQTGWEIRTELVDSERGTGGFGSTGTE